MDVKAAVHFKKKQTFTDNLLSKSNLLLDDPHVIQDVHVFLSSVEKKLSF